MMPVPVCSHAIDWRRPSLCRRASCRTFDGPGAHGQQAAGSRMPSVARQERQDGQPRASCIDLVELISNRGAQANIDAGLAQLYRRVLFNVAVGNREMSDDPFLLEPLSCLTLPAFL